MLLWDMELLPAPPVGMKGVCIERTEVVGEYRYFISYRNRKVEVNQFARNGVAGMDGKFFTWVNGVWFATTSAVAYVTGMRQGKEVIDDEE